MRPRTDVNHYLRSGYKCSVVVLMFALGACGPIGVATKAMANGKDGQPGKVDKELGPGHPVTIVLPLTAASAWHAEMEGGQGKKGQRPLRLVIEGVKVSSGQSHGFRLFLNKPDANEATPTDDPHYVSSLALFPSTASSEPVMSGANFRVDLDRSLQALAAAGRLELNKPLTITLVAIPGEQRGESEQARITISSVKLE